MLQSRASYNDAKNLCTFEMLFTVIVDMKFLDTVLEHVWQDPVQKDKLIEIVMQVICQRGRFVALMYEINSHKRSEYLNQISEFLNERHIVENEDFLKKV